MKWFSFGLMTLVFIYPTLTLGNGSFHEEGSDKTIMRGDYIWNEEPDKKGTLEAVFQKVKPGEYQVAFYLEVNGKKWTYSGSAKGNLMNGSLKGEVKNDVIKTTYRFMGKSEAGVFKGTHMEILKNAEEVATGTMSMRITK